MHGFTCGIGDLLLTEVADVGRTELLKKADGLGIEGCVRFLAGNVPVEQRFELRAALAARLQGCKGRKDGEASGALLDGAVKERLMPLTSDAGAACLPKGQLIAFPRNNFALMTSTGAKGGTINFSQISVMLGQQELEGRRVPLSPSGCTAPCFAPYELSARAGGCARVHFGIELCSILVDWRATLHFRRLLQVHY